MWVRHRFILGRAVALPLAVRCDTLPVRCEARKPCGVCAEVFALFFALFFALPPPTRSDTVSRNIAWLNGKFVNEADATVSIFDRGLLFGDAVYDVVTVLQGRLLDTDYHLARLDRSCAAIGLANALTVAEWREVLLTLLRETGVTEGLVYMQVTRGVAERHGIRERDFAFPKDTLPSAFAYARSKVLLNDPNAAGVRVVTTPDIRWERRDIKTTSLLAPVLAKQFAREHGAFEAFMHEDGVITEGGSSNAFMVKNGVVITRPLAHAILAGVTRHVILDIAAEAGIAIEERPFTVAEALGADELFLSSATTFVLPVVELDGVMIGDGRPGAISVGLRGLYVARGMAGG
jgi:D-alanine transaminase